LKALGIPKDYVLPYETASKADNFMRVAHGDAQQIGRAHGLLAVSGLATFDHRGA